MFSIDFLTALGAKLRQANFRRRRGVNSQV